MFIRRYENLCSWDGEGQSDVALHIATGPAACRPRTTSQQAALSMHAPGRGLFLNRRLRCRLRRLGCFVTLQLVFACTRIRKGEVQARKLTTPSSWVKFSSSRRSRLRPKSARNLCCNSAARHSFNLLFSWNFGLSILRR